MIGKNSKICVIGTGRCARSCSAYLISRGYENVFIWGRDKQQTDSLNKDGIIVKGVLDGTFKVKASDDIKEAVSGAELIIVQTTTPGHRPVAERLKGLLEKDQIILVFNGNWGAYEFYEVLGEEAEAKNVIIAETSAQVFMSTISGNEVSFNRLKQKSTAASAIASRTPELIERLSEVLPMLAPAENVISTSLNSSNPVLHTPIALFNIARIENAEDFMFYLNGASRHVVHASEKLDAERCKVAEAMGVKPVTCLDIINSFWPDKFDNLYDALKHDYPFTKGPVTLKYRFFEEDLPFGMAAVGVLGKLYGVSTPSIDTMLDTYKWILDTEFRELAPHFDAELLRKLG